jgi:hypothetical protein
MARLKEGFSKIQREHAEQACKALLSEGAVRGGGSYFVVFGKERLPAKAVLKVAYKLANGQEISSREFSGGLYTQRILERLGLVVEVAEPGPTNP